MKERLRSLRELPNNYQHSNGSEILTITNLTKRQLSKCVQLLHHKRLLAIPVNFGLLIANRRQIIPINLLNRYKFATFANKHAN